MIVVILNLEHNKIVFSLCIKNEKKNIGGRKNDGKKNGEKGRERGR